MGPTTTGTAVRLGVDARRRRSRSGGVSRQIAQQRRGYAGAVLRAPYTQRREGLPEDPPHHRHRTTPMSAVSGAELHDLAVGISAGRPVALP